MAKMVKDENGTCYAVPTVWEINNVYFPRKQWHWFIKPKVSMQYRHLVESFIGRAGLGHYFTQYDNAISEQYRNHLRIRLLNLAIRAILIYRNNPQHFGHNPNFVMMKILGYWKNILYVRIVQCNNHGMSLPVWDNEEGINTKPFIVKESEYLYDQLEPVIKELFPLYVKRMDLIAKRR